MRSWNARTNTPRSAKSIRYEMLRQALTKQGYYTPVVCLSAEMRYRMIVVLINHLASVLDWDPKRVYAAALCRAERTALGRPYCAYKQAQAEHEALLRMEGAMARWAYCPECGADLVEPETPEGVKKAKKTVKKTRNGAKVATKV